MCRRRGRFNMPWRNCSRGGPASWWRIACLRCATLIASWCYRTVKSLSAAPMTNCCAPTGITQSCTPNLCASSVLTPQPTLTRFSEMTHAQAKARHAELAAEIREHDYAYYVEAKPRVNDREYDRLYRELCELETQF